jgi:3-oxoadipate enol-lactonase
MIGRMPTLEANGITIGYDVHGEGPPLLLIMGLTGTRRHWLGFDERLARRGRKVVVFDNRGAGETTSAPGPYTMEQLAGDTLAVLDALAIPRADVLGVSMGGMIAQELSARAPDRVRSLVLGCTHFGGARHVAHSQEVVEAFTSVEGKSAEQIVRQILAINFTERFRRERVDELERLVALGLQSRMRRAAFFAQLAAIAGHDTEARLASLDVPTLVVTGSEDRLIDPANSRLLASAIRGAELAVLPDAGHMFWVEAADAALAVVSSFLDRVGR